MCLICSQFELCSSRRARNHITQGCTRVPEKVKKRLVECGGLSEDQPRRDTGNSESSQQFVVSKQSNQTMPMMQSQYHEPTPPGHRQYYGGHWAASNAESNVASTHAATIYASRLSADVRIMSSWRKSSDYAIGKHVIFWVISRKRAGNHDDVQHRTNNYLR